jgi:hypothetical protein
VVQPTPSSAWSAIDWSQAVPPGLALPLSHYPQLEQSGFDRDVQLGLARLATCFSCELFIHFEGYLIDYLSRYPERVPMLSRRALERFVEEERVHSAAFGRLLSKLRPDLYPCGEPIFLIRRPVEDWVLSRLSPTTFFLLAMLFEEITLFVPEAMRAAPEDCSELVRQVMSLHARDERGHVGLDATTLRKLGQGQPRWRTRASVCATLPVLWFVDRQVERGWRRGVERARFELGLSRKQQRYLLRRQPTQSDRWGVESFVEKLGRLGLPGGGLVCRALTAQLG